MPKEKKKNWFSREKSDGPPGRGSTNELKFGSPENSGWGRAALGRSLEKGSDSKKVQLNFT